MSDTFAIFAVPVRPEAPERMREAGIERREASGAVYVWRQEGAGDALHALQSVGLPQDVVSVNVDFGVGERVPIVREGQNAGCSGDAFAGA